MAGDNDSVPRVTVTEYLVRLHTLCAWTSKMYVMF